MSSSHRTGVFDLPKQDVDPKHYGYALPLALLCVGLALAVASVFFTPVTMGSGISSEISLVGP
jgi:hypothetical protein